VFAPTSLRVGPQGVTAPTAQPSAALPTAHGHLHDTPDRLASHTHRASVTSIPEAAPRPAWGRLLAVAGVGAVVLAAVLGFRRASSRPPEVSSAALPTAPVRESGTASSSPPPVVEPHSSALPPASVPEMASAAPPSTSTKPKAPPPRPSPRPRHDPTKVFE